MTWVRELKTGDVIVDCGSVCEVYKIEEELVYFKPFYEKGNSPITCSIPVDNISKTKIRKLITKKRVVEVLRELVVTIEEEIEADMEAAKTALAENKPIGLVRVINKLWNEQIDRGEGFSKSKENALDFAVDSLAEEVAYLYGCDLEEGKKKILARLKRVSK